MCDCRPLESNAVDGAAAEHAKSFASTLSFDGRSSAPVLRTLPEPISACHGVHSNWRRLCLMCGCWPLLGPLSWPEEAALCVAPRVAAFWAPRGRNKGMPPPPALHFDAFCLSCPCADGAVCTLAGGSAGCAASVDAFNSTRVVTTVAVVTAAAASSASAGRKDRSSALHRTRARTCTARSDRRLLALQPPLLLLRAASLLTTPPTTHMSRPAPSPQVKSPSSRRHGAATTPRESAAASAGRANMALFRPWLGRVGRW